MRNRVTLWVCVCVYEVRKDKLRNKTQLGLLCYYLVVFPQQEMF